MIVFRSFTVVLGWLTLLTGALFLVFGVGAFIDVVQELFGGPSPTGREYVLGPLLAIAGGLLVWGGRNWSTRDLRNA